MAKLKRNGVKVFIELSDLEKSELGTTNSELQVLKAGNELFILSGRANTNNIERARDASNRKAQNINGKILENKKSVRSEKERKENERLEKIDKKIFGLLREKKLKDLVEGKFEKFLSKEENKRLGELVKEGVVIKFRLSKDYKKPVYRLSRKASAGKGGKKSKGNESKVQSEGDGKSFICGENGFTVVRSEWNARKLQEELRNAFEQKLVRAMKDFDNSYYFIDESVFEKNSEAILGFLEEVKKASLESLANSLGLRRDVVKGVCCFLKEEGFLIEKTKGNYELII